MTKNAAQPEDSVKARLNKLLPRYFLFRPEVTGIGPDGQEVRIDYWCYPTPALVGRGWEAKPFGIEAKAAELEDHRKRTCVRLIYQAAIYRFSQFPTKSGPTRPDFVLIYPCISMLLGMGLRERNERATFQDGIEYALVRLAALWRVGELMLDESYCEVRFNGATWFDSNRGRRAANPLAAETTRASR